MQSRRGFSWVVLAGVLVLVGTGMLVPAGMRRTTVEIGPSPDKPAQVGQSTPRSPGFSFFLPGSESHPADSANFLEMSSSAGSDLLLENSSQQLFGRQEVAPSNEQVSAPTGQPAPAEDGKLRIICFGAHPDDAEIRCGGVAALWAAEGHHVKFVSVTNGDIGHWAMAGGPLAKRRTAEVQQAAKILGVATEVLDIHDGELEPTLQNRKLITRLIRDWQADIVIGHRPYDYHPDHRYVGVLIQDSAFMVMVPFICPDTPPLKRNPVFLYSYDGFQRPVPFRADIVVAIDSVIDKKIDALAAMESQFIEGGALGSAETAPKTPEEREAKRQRVRENFRRGFADLANRYRDKLIELYGEEAGKKVQYAEAFEICEYGRQPSREELRRLFPFLPKR